MDKAWRFGGQTQVFSPIVACITLRNVCYGNGHFVGLGESVWVLGIPPSKCRNSNSPPNKSFLEVTALGCAKMPQRGIVEVLRLHFLHSLVELIVYSMDCLFSCPNPLLDDATESSRHLSICLSIHVVLGITDIINWETIFKITMSPAVFREFFIPLEKLHPPDTHTYVPSYWKNSSKKQDRMILVTSLTKLLELGLIRMSSASL